MKIAVLGTGMVGSAIAIDLSKQYKVTSFDINENALKLLSAKAPQVAVQKADLTNYENYEKLLFAFDFVVSAVPGFMGYETLKAIINAKKDVVDISFFPEDALELDALAKMNNVTAIVDCGVAPGMSNLILGYYNEKMTVTDFEFLVGGLPKRRVKPFEYKAPFSPVDVIEIYTRPSRLMENGKIVTKPALSEAELIDFEPVGTLEAFNSDGLRSILFTMSHIPNMKEKTLRYPGHIDLIESLIKAGFLNEEKINFNGVEISPLEFSSKILFKQWQLLPTEEEFTIMRVIVAGNENGKPRKVVYDLYDTYDAPTQTSSMSRTTGYTCTAALNLLINKLFTAKGVFPPELVGKDEKCFSYVMKYLEQRNIIYKKNEM